MKRLRLLVFSVLSCLMLFMPLTACNDPVDDACDTIETMDSQKNKIQDALDAFNEDADEKDAEAQEILDLVE